MILFQLANKYWAPQAKNKLPFDPQVSPPPHQTHYWCLLLSPTLTVMLFLGDERHL